MKKPKKKLCKLRGCKVWFIPTFSSTQQVCSPGCAYKYELQKKADKEKKERKQNKKRLEELRPASYWVKKAQASFNAYVRARDYGQPCISSGREMDWNALGGKVDSGHYRSRGSAPHLRFNLHNCHAQSVHDNRYKSGNVTDYRINLIQKIGLEKVEALENNNAIRRFDIEYLKRIIRVFNKRTRRKGTLCGI